MRVALAVALATALTAAVAPAAAGPAGLETGLNLVANGGFESGLAGWSTSGFQLLGYDFGIDTAAAHTGTSSFQGGAIESLGFLSQTLVTVPGTSYNIGLWLASDGFFENRFQVLWNGQVVYDQSNLFPQGFTSVLIDPLATGTSTTLAFGFRNDSGFLHLDDVSVRAVASVPEPSEVALIAAGLAALGYARRWRRAATGRRRADAAWSAARPRATHGGTRAAKVLSGPSDAVAAPRSFALRRTRGAGVTRPPGTVG